MKQVRRDFERRMKSQLERKVRRKVVRSLRPLILQVEVLRKCVNLVWWELME